MDVRELSSNYQVRKLTVEDVDLIYGLSIGNPMFYEYCPPYVTKESITEDMRALPPGKHLDDKFYVGYFRNNALVAIMDLVLFYPNKNTAWIGLFMMNPQYQGKGYGSKIIEECAAHLKHIGFESVQLAFAKGNPQSEAFWQKNGFEKTGNESKNETYTAVIMQRVL